jgi:hypothetical protein
MAINKKQWFDVRDSVVEREDGKGKYFNVQARFSDLAVINVEKSRIKRHNVYEYSIVLHTKVKRTMGDQAAQPNVTSQPLRFDKPELRGPDFEAAKALIMRCPEAWNHYQKYREAPVTEAEEKALHQIALHLAHQARPGKVMVEVNGELVERDIDPDAEEEDPEEDAVPPKISAPRKAVPVATKPRAKRPGKKTTKAA